MGIATLEWREKAARLINVMRMGEKKESMVSETSSPQFFQIAMSERRGYSSCKSDERGGGS